MPLIEVLPGTQHNTDLISSAVYCARDRTLRLQLVGEGPALYDGQQADDVWRALGDDAANNIGARVGIGPAAGESVTVEWPGGRETSHARLSNEERESLGRMHFEMFSNSPDWRQVSEECRETYRANAEKLVFAAAVARPDEPWHPVFSEQSWLEKRVRAWLADTRDQENTFNVIAALSVMGCLRNPDSQACETGSSGEEVTSPPDIRALADRIVYAFDAIDGRQCDNEDSEAIRKRYHERFVETSGSSQDNRVGAKADWLAPVLAEFAAAQHATAASPEHFDPTLPRVFRWPRLVGGWNVGVWRPDQGYYFSEYGNPTEGPPDIEGLEWVGEAPPELPPGFRMEENGKGYVAQGPDGFRANDSNGLPWYSLRNGQPWFDSRKFAARAAWREWLRRYRAEAEAVHVGEVS